MSGHTMNDTVTTHKETITLHQMLKDRVERGRDGGSGGVVDVVVVGGDGNNGGKGSSSSSSQ